MSFGPENLDHPDRFRSALFPTQDALAGMSLAEDNTHFTAEGYAQAEKALIEAERREHTETVEIYEGDLKMVAHQALEVLARKTRLQYVPGEENELHLDQIADALLSTLKNNNRNIDIVVVRKR